MHCDILIPTYKNPKMLNDLVISILRNQGLLRKIIIINNGTDPIDQMFKNDRIEVLNPNENLGWEGGLKLGLAKSTAPFVVFMNDDTLVPISSAFWLEDMIRIFEDPKVGACGPISNCVAGLQNIFYNPPPVEPTEVSYLIGFCVLVRRSALDEVGGIDDTLPGGDDFDLSIRLRKAGYKCVIQPKTFIYHHGFVTGTKVHGGPKDPNGWNSIEMTDRTNQGLIRKHGFKEFLFTARGIIPKSDSSTPPDSEGDLVRSFVEGERILELGVGAQKTVDRAIGLDIVPKGELMEGFGGQFSSIADFTCDVSRCLPFADQTADCIIARHILEHCIDVVSTLKEWRRVLKPFGKLIIAVPNQELLNTIPLNPQHVHAFTPKSLYNLLTLCRFEVEDWHDSGNKISFVCVANKIPVEEKVYA